MLINPRRRKAKRKAAPAKRRAKRRTVVRTNPVAPIRKRRVSRRSTLKAVSRRRPRRNPIGLGGIVGTLTDAAIGAGGALAINFVFDKLPLPMSMKVGNTGMAAKAAIAIAVGTFGKKFLGNTAGKMAAGALTVIAYDVMRNLLPPPMLQTTAGMGYIASGQNAGYIGGNGMGEYINGGDFNFATNGAAMGEYINTGY